MLQKSVEIPGVNEGAALAARQPQWLCHGAEPANWMDIIGRYMVEATNVIDRCVREDLFRRGDSEFLCPVAGDRIGRRAEVALDRHLSSLH